MNTTFKVLRNLIAFSIIGISSTNGLAASFVLAYTDGQIPQSYTNLQAFYGNLNAVGLGSTYGMTAAGTIDSSGLTATTTSIIAFAKSKMLPLYPTVSDYNNSLGAFDPAISNAMLATSSKRSAASASLVNLAVNNGFAGVNVDFEAVQPGDKTNYSSFLSTLSAALHARGLKLIVSIPPMDADNLPDYLAGYDYAAIGAVTDYFQLMTYDEAGPGWSSSTSGTWPAPELGLDWLNAKLTYAVSRVSAAKILSGLPSYGYDFSTGNQVYWRDFAPNAHSGTVLARDTVSATPYARWGSVTQQSGAWSTSTAQPVLWYDDTQSITTKTKVVAQYGLGGTSVWAMGYEDANFWSGVAAGLLTSGGPDYNIGPTGTGYVWSGNSSATANTGKLAKAAVNDGNVGTTLILTSNGEAGAVKWEAAGVIFLGGRTISSTKFFNGSLDNYGNGYFESGLSLQYTINGTTWIESGWTVKPSYPNTASAVDAIYTFSGSSISGVTGVRVSGRSGPSSWSGSTKEVQVIGH